LSSSLYRVPSRLHLQKDHCLTRLSSISGYTTSLGAYSFSTSRRRLGPVTTIFPKDSIAQTVLNNINLWNCSIGFVEHDEEVIVTYIDIATIDTDKPEDATSIVTTHYSDFLNVFSEEEANKLPKHQPYDHKIDLVPGSKLPVGRIFQLSPKENWL
jgi:hypothetical protein